MVLSFLNGIERRQMLQGARVTPCSLLKVRSVGAEHVGSSVIFRASMHTHEPFHQVQGTFIATVVCKPYK